MTVDPVETNEKENEGKRNAQEYADAVAAVADIAGLVIEFIPGVRAAKTVSRAIPVVKHVASSVPQMAEHADKLGPVFNKVKGSVPGAAKNAASAVKQKGSAVASAATRPITEGIASMKVEKARKEARCRIIEHAIGQFPTSKFLTDLETHQTISAGRGDGYLCYAGCFIFLTLGKGVKRDLADYKEVYVGSSVDMGAAIKRNLDGDGNADVYVDAKYDQNVHVLVYPCAESELVPMREALIAALDADVSYNAREL